MNNENFYRNNNKYAMLLEAHSEKMFQKYIDTIKKVTGEKKRFLDVGCGTGVVVNAVKEIVESCGVDVSDVFIKKCNEKNLDCFLYDGKNIPYPEKSFEIVGSYNVLEHVDNPIEFLNDQLRVLVDGGYLILACPNFLAITNDYHWHTAGFIQKQKNLLSFARRLFSGKYYFEKMTPVRDEEFKSDHDACNITNPLDILKWAREKKLELRYWSANSTYKKGLINYLDYSIIKYFLGSSFFVFKKYEIK